MSIVTGGYEVLGKQMKEHFLRLKWDALGRARYLNGTLESASRQIGKIFQDLTECVKVRKISEDFLMPMLSSQELNLYVKESHDWLWKERLQCVI